MMNRADAGVDRVLRRKQFRAAWSVLLRRPFTLGLVPVFFPLIMVLVKFFGGDVSSGLQSNVPSYSVRGKVLRDADEIAAFYESGETDASVATLSFHRSASIDAAQGSAFLMLERIQSGASGREIADAVPFEKAGGMLKQFPNLRSIRFIGQQLRKTSSRDLNQLPKLETIELSTSELNVRDVERLSQVRSLRRIKISALWCDVDLSPLCNLPDLESVHLTSTGRSSTDPNKGLLLSPRHVAEIAKCSTLQELILETDALWSSHDGQPLSAEQSQEIAKFANSLSQAPLLKSLYIGRQNSSVAREAMRQLKAALPQVSVRPAWCMREVGNFFGLSCFVCGLCVVMAGTHFVSCTSLPQASVVPGLENGHRRVFAWLVFAGMVVQLLFLMIVVEAHWFPSLAACLAVATLAFGWLRLGIVGFRADKTPGNFAVVLIAFAPCAIVFVGIGMTDRLEWFLYGEQPVLAAVMIAVFGVLLYRCWQGMGFVWRFWAENGLESSAGMQGFMATLGTLGQKQLNSPFAERIGDEWTKRLRKLGDSLNATESPVQRMELWVMGMRQLRISRILLNSAFIIPVSCMLLVGFEYITKGQVLKISRGLIAAMSAWILIVIVGMSGASLYGRFPMFASELLRPVSRNSWRNSALVSTMALSVFFSTCFCTAALMMRSILLGWPNFAWAVSSVFASAAYAVIGTAIVIWVVMMRRMKFTITGVILLFVAVVPVTALLSEGIGLSRTLASGFPSTQGWLLIAAVEAAAGILLFTHVWRNWKTMELAREE